MLFEIKSNTFNEAQKIAKKRLLQIAKCTNIDYSNSKSDVVYPDGKYGFRIFCCIDSKNEITGLFVRAHCMDLPQTDLTYLPIFGLKSQNREEGKKRAAEILTQIVAAIKKI